MRRQRPKAPWTVARLAALLGRLKHKPTFTELRTRYGVTLKTLVALNIGVLGTVGETEGGRDTCLAIQFGDEVAFSLAGPSLEKAASLSKTEIFLAVTGLRWTLTEPEQRKVLREMAERLIKAGGPLEEARHDVYLGPLWAPQVSANFLTIIGAVGESKCLHFQYPAHGGGMSVRRVRPLSFRKDAGEWRLLAWDDDKNAQRVFKLVHMRAVEALPEVFAWPDNLDRAEILGRDLSVYRPSGEEVRVTLKIRAGAMRRCQALFPNHRAPKVGNAWVRAEILSASPEWVARVFLPYLHDVKVMGPVEYMKAMEDEIKAVQANYF